MAAGIILDIYPVGLGFFLGTAVFDDGMVKDYIVVNVKPL